MITIDCRKDRSTSATKKNTKSRAPSASKPNPFNLDYDKFKTKEDAVDKLLSDVKKFKVALPDGFNAKMLYDGYGDGVCYIVNDLTNRELIRRNFKFEQFKIKEDGLMSQAYMDDIEEDMIIEGSTVFNTTGDMAFGVGNNQRDMGGSSLRMTHEYVPRGSKKNESKDLTAEA